MTMRHEVYSTSPSAEQIKHATAAVGRASYIDPRIIDLYEQGITIDPALGGLGRDRDFGEGPSPGAPGRRPRRSRGPELTQPRPHARVHAPPLLVPGGVKG